MIIDLLELMAPDAGNDGGTILTGNQPGTEGNAGDSNNGDNQTNNPEEGSVMPGWVSGVGAEYKDYVKDYKTPTDFIKAAKGWNEKLQNSIVKPGEGATAQEVEAYRKVMGIPDKTEGYELPESDLMSEEFTSTQREFYLKNNLSNEQAKEVHKALISHMEKGIDAIQKANLQAREEAETALKGELGDKYNQTLKDAQNALRRFASEEDVKYLTKTGLGNDAGIIKMFANIQKQIGGDSLLNLPSSATSKNEAKERFPNSPEQW